MHLPELTLTQLANVGGDIFLPGSKSITNRALLVASMARGNTRLNNLLLSDDTRFMLAALRHLGVGIQQDPDDETSVSVSGADGPLVTVNRSHNQPELLQLGMAGTAYRPLTAALCLGTGEFVLDGNARMYERPVADLVDGLRQLGAEIDYLQNEGFPPVRVRGTGLRGGSIRMRGDISSQFLTSVLLAAPLASAPVEIAIEGELVSKPYLEITLALMKSFGAHAEHDNYERFMVAPGGYTGVENYLVEGDASNATYFLAAGALRGSGVTVHGIGSSSVQGDVAFADVLRAMGAGVEILDEQIRVTPAAQIKAIDMDLNHIPDAAMTAAVLAVFADGESHLRNLYNLRVKETDRLHALATELRKVGAIVVEERDALHITPPVEIKSAAIDTYDDHRMAMCFSLLALAGMPVTIRDPGCVAKTFPNFFAEFAQVAAAAA
ncbi:MAG: 3-phosphoshikimate 1-carboxyvinyltransferase [Pseudomonadota bacterium]